MPTYNYHCDSCGHDFEEFQKITDEPITTCPKCKADEVKRIITGGAGFVLKGSGFYSTDYRSPSYNEGKKKDEFVVIGAHMDHMGMSGGRIWNGADDNASGTVGVMTIARAFAATGEQPERTVIFCAWTGEEKGLLGSEYFTRHPTYSEMGNCKFYINFDMISRCLKVFLK